MSGFAIFAIALNAISLVSQLASISLGKTCPGVAFATMNVVLIALIAANEL